MFFIIFLILIIFLSVIFNKSYNIKFIDNRNLKIVFDKTKKDCKVLKYTDSTLPVELKCYVKKLIVTIMKFLNKTSEIFVSRNEITNLELIYNTSYSNFIIDIFVWNIEGNHYDFLKFDIIVDGNNLYLNSINYINRKHSEININSTNNSKYHLYKPLKNQSKKDFIKQNKCILPSSIRNKWILQKEPYELYKEGRKQWPCNPVSSDWDEYGILKNKKNEDKNCKGNNTSTQNWPLIPYDNPTITGYNLQS